MDQNNRNRRSSSFYDDENQGYNEYRQNEQRQGRENDFSQQRYNEGNYGNQQYNRQHDQFGNANRNRQQGSNDWNDYGNQFNQGNYGSGRSQDDHFRSNRNDDDRRNWRNDDNFRSSGGRNYDNQGNYDNNSGWQNRGNQGWGNQGYGNQGWGNSGQQRDWWDKTRDEVSSWFGDDDAQRRRHQDSHNRGGEHKGKGPKNYQRSQDRIREDINDRLSDDHWVDASDIDVKVSGSDVTLTGTVNSREEKRRAEDIAEAVSGVSNVQNQLRVGKASSSLSDTERPTSSTTSLTSNANSNTGKSESLRNS